MRNDRQPWSQKVLSLTVESPWLHLPMELFNVHIALSRIRQSNKSVSFFLILISVFVFVFTGELNYQIAFYKVTTIILWGINLAKVKLRKVRPDRGMTSLPWSMEMEQNGLIMQMAGDSTRFSHRGRNVKDNSWASDQRDRRATHWHVCRYLVCSGLYAERTKKERNGNVCMEKKTDNSVYGEPIPSMGCWRNALQP